MTFYKEDNTLIIEEGLTFTCILDHASSGLVDPKQFDAGQVTFFCYCGFPGWMHEREWRTSILLRKKPCKVCSAPTIGRVKQDSMCHKCWVGGTVDFESGVPVASAT